MVKELREITVREYNRLLHLGRIRQVSTPAALQVPHEFESALGSYVYGNTKLRLANAYMCGPQIDSVRNTHGLTDGYSYAVVPIIFYKISKGETS